MLGAMVVTFLAGSSITTLVMYRDSIGYAKNCLECAIATGVGQHTNHLSMPHSSCATIPNMGSGHHGPPED